MTTVSFPLAVNSCILTKSPTELDLELPVSSESKSLQVLSVFQF